MTVEVICGDVIDVLATYADSTFTSTFSDPPYGYDFMCAKWDHGVPGVPYWAEVLRVSKPGAVLLAFGGSRTHHRLYCAIEDAGYEIFDSGAWIHAQGFPKSTSISKQIDKAAGKERKVVGRRPIAYPDSDCWGIPNHHSSGVTNNPVAYKIPTEKNGGNYGGARNITAPATPDAVIWDGYGTSLKPAIEFICCARKPRGGTYAQCAIEHGSGALNIAGTRIEVGDGEPNLRTTKSRRDKANNGYDGGWEAVPRVFDGAHGRWPSNLILDPTSARLLGEQSGVREPGYRQNPSTNKTTWFGSRTGDHVEGERGYADTGTAARFFYCAKAARGERDAGLEGLPLKDGDECYGDGLGNGPDRIARRNPHPCLKPLDLCRYFATLIRPPEAYLDDAVLCVPFCGTGSEIIGAILAGWRNIVGIELDADTCDIARARVAWWQRAHDETGLSDPKAILKVMKKRKPAPMFEVAAS